MCVYCPARTGFPRRNYPNDKTSYVAEPSVRPLRVSVENLSIRSEAGHVENQLSDRFPAIALTMGADRRLCFTAALANFLAEPDALRVPIFLDHQGCFQALIDEHPTSRFRRQPAQLPELATTEIF